MQALKSFCDEYYGRLPYMLVQPYLENPREMKLIFLGGNFSHISKYSKRGGQSFASDEEMIAFAKRALDQLLLNGANAVWLDQLVRVDIMVTADGRMVVNEIESLEAMYSGSVKDDERVISFLTDYWRVQVARLMQESLGEGVTTYVAT